MTENKKKLSLYGLIMIAAGACIGSGIFLTPGKIATSLNNVNLIMLIWLIGGIVSIFGALTYAELGSRFTQKGGIYVYIKEAYGEMAGFIYGWIILFVITSGSIAALGVGVVGFLENFVELSGNMKSVVAGAIIAGLTVINIFGVKIGEYISNVFTGAKIIAILAIIIIPLFFLDSAPENMATNVAESTIPENLFSVFFLAFVGVFWSFGGWHHTSYLAAESVNPSRNIPMAMILGTALVTILYLGANYAYLHYVPIAEMDPEGKIAFDAFAAVSPYANSIISSLIILSMIGTIAIYTMSAPRIYHAMANDKIFFKFIAKTHPKYKTPANAMLIQAAWAIGLIFAWKQFNSIITFVTFMDICFMAIGASTIFVFRKRSSEKPKAKAWGYPVIPILYLTVTGIFVLNTAISLSAETIVGFLLLLAGIPVYYFFKKSREQ